MSARGLIPLVLAGALAAGMGTAVLRHTFVSTAPGSSPGTVSHAPGPTAEQEGDVPVIGAAVGIARPPVTDTVHHSSTPPSGARHEAPRRPATRRQV
ncbi:MAG TPA: hypothetical protein VEP50_04475, partial [bacterium]|nr:hypothetical protein [bacterium]